MTAPAETPSPQPWQLICLCANWCGTCRDYRPQLLHEAARHPGVRFAWVDIEDQADAMGDIDIETFPTLLIAQGHRVRFLGPVLPSTGAIGRLLESLREDETRVTAPPGADALLARLEADGLQSP
jgi:thioredoxin-like negative regulator of GroEL